MSVFSLIGEQQLHFTQSLKLHTVEYRQSAPPIFTLGWQEIGGGGVG